MKENEKSNAFNDFLDVLKENGYEVSFQVVDCVKYGIPQTRRRLVLLASKLGRIRLIPPTHKIPKTLKETIGDLPAIKAGEQDKKDSYHIGRKLSQINMERIKKVPKN
jgi:DNA (cytosine-5)-methyltransferase 1